MLEGPQLARPVIARQSCALFVCRRTEGAVNDMVLTRCSGNLQVCIGFVVRLSYVVRVELSTQGLACQVSGGPASSPTSSALPTEAPVVMVCCPQLFECNCRHGCLNEGLGSWPLTTVQRSL